VHLESTRAQVDLAETLDLSRRVEELLVINASGAR
jgi:hypothetical protein